MRLIPLLLPRYRVFALTRRPDQLEALRRLGATALPGDLDDPASLLRMAGLVQDVVHLAPPPTQGSRDTRTRHLIQALGAVERLVYISTSGVYGDCEGAYVTETRRVQPQSARAQRRVDAEQVLRGWARRSGTRLSILRVPGIYAVNRLPRERLAAGTPALTPADDVYTNHVHADDLARITLAALHFGAPQRVYHASDDSDLMMGEYFDAVADAFGMTRPPRLPRAALAAAVSPMLLSFMSESRRLVNHRIKAELGVRLRYPGVADALREMTAATVANPAADD